MALVDKPHNSRIVISRTAAVQKPSSEDSARQPIDPWELLKQDTDQSELMSLTKHEHGDRTAVSPPEKEGSVRPKAGLHEHPDMTKCPSTAGSAARPERKPQDDNLKRNRPAKKQTVLLRFGLPGANTRRAAVRRTSSSDTPTTEQCVGETESGVQGFHGASGTGTSAIVKPTEQLEDELKEMKELLRQQKAQSDQQVQLLQTELSKKKQRERHAAQKFKQLERALNTEREKTKKLQLQVEKDEKSSFSAQEEEISRLTKSWICTLENSRSQWKGEKVCLMAEHIEGIYSLKEMYKQDLENSRSYWMEERSCLLVAHEEEISRLTKSWVDTLEKVRAQSKEEKVCLLAEHAEVVSNLKAMCKQDLEIRRSQWKEEKSRLLAAHEEEISRLTKSWIDTLEKSRSQWKEEESRLLAEHADAVARLKEMSKQDVEVRRSEQDEQRFCSLGAREEEHDTFTWKEGKADRVKEEMVSEEPDRDREQKDVRDVRVDIEQDSDSRGRFQLEEKKIQKLQSQKKKKKLFFGLFKRKKVATPGSDI